jgi:16S rRNA (cytosine1402-N4)-methyltransferase
MHDGPLDMRFDPTSGEITAADIVNTWPAPDLADLFFTYGEERASRKIAQAITQARPLTTTRQLAAVIEKTIRREPGDRLHPATRIFQALRIEVNGELDAVQAVLPIALELLKPGGRLAVITFHSLEDRLVKNFIRAHARGLPADITQPVPADFVPTLREITRKPLEADADEVARNPRARSAKLRIAEKL